MQYARYSLKTLESYKNIIFEHEEGDVVVLNVVNDVELIGASEAARLLGVNKNKIYELWKNNELTWWCIGGTKKTTKEAIAMYLYSKQNLSVVDVES